MNGWDTIAKVRLETSQASFLAKDGKKKAAAACMKRARNLLAQYCKDERYPDHGFEAEIIEG